MKIIVYSDSGHAWGKVKHTEVNILKQGSLGLRISSCSYQKGAYVYLEEDCDLPAFIDAWRVRNPTKQVEFIEQYTEGDSRIRAYKHYYRGY